MPYVGKKPADIIATAVDTTTGTFSGDIDASTVNATGDTAAGDNAAIGFTSAEGLILTGQGSTSDITVKNDADATVFTVPTGTDDILFPDNAKILIGAGSDIQIYHDGSYSRIMESGGTALVLDTTSTDIRLTASNSEVMGKFVKDGAVELYHNGSKKIETSSTGVAVTGAISASSGDITITDGNLVVASGHGIDFSANSNASGMSSELLDSYEEGTWTPTIFGGTTAGTYQLEAVRTGGKYTKIGRLVTIDAVLRISSIDSAGAGSLNFGGLPFAFGTALGSAWHSGHGVKVEHYGAGAQSSADSMPPPFSAVGSPSASTFSVHSFGKNYQVTSNIQTLSATSWIYQIAGTYMTS